MKYLEIGDRIADGGAVIKGSEAVLFLKQMAKDCIDSGDEKEIVLAQLEDVLGDIEKARDLDWVLIEECPMASSGLIIKEMIVKE